MGKKQSIICYSPLPQSKYMLGVKFKKVKGMKSISLGLGDPDIVKDPLLWNYCSLTSRLLYLWEDNKVRPKNKPSRFPLLDEARKDLKKKIGGTSVRAYMGSTPVEFMDAVVSNPVRDLEVCKFFDSEKVFRSIVTSRVYVWLQSRGEALTPEQEAVVAMVKKDI